MTTAAAPVVEVAGLARRFGSKRALVDFSLCVPPGSIHGVVGANGGGKTTAMRLLAGLLAPEAGRGTVAGLPLSAPVTARRERLGYMTQGFSLHPQLSVRENCLARAMIYRLAQPQQAVAQVLHAHGLTALAERRVGELSGGWMRRAQFAATLVHAPRLLLLDEPTAGLDAGTRQFLWERLAALAAAGCAIVINTHDLDEAAACDRLAVLVAGVVVASGSAAELIARAEAEVWLLPARPGEDPSGVRARIPGVRFARRRGSAVEVLFRGAPPAAARAALAAASPQPAELAHAVILLSEAG